ncbi:MAG: heavy-metal-associated domain-containing protein [Thermoleophilia bacterium]
MEELVLAVPGMWADHHVLTVRDLLGHVDGVAAISASALDAAVRVEYDPAVADPQSIAAALDEAGYPTGAGEPAAPPPTNKPAWATAGVRVTVTNPSDLTMSGDHRKY